MARGKQIGLLMLGASFLALVACVPSASVRRSENRETRTEDVTAVTARMLKGVRQRNWSAESNWCDNSRASSLPGQFWLRWRF